MSTRSCTTIKTALGHIALYRHCDGYPAEAGATIIEAILESWPKHPGSYSDFGTNERLVTTLLALRYEATEFRRDSGIYEITTKADDHVDLEWTYKIEHVTGPFGWRITVGELFSWNSSWKKTQMNLDGLVAWVNRDREEINRRVAHHVGPKGAGYPMLVLPKGEVHEQAHEPAHD